VKLNPDCIRDILITVENSEFGSHMTLEKLCEKLPNYTRDEIHYCCIKLNEAGMLEVLIVQMMRQTMPGIKTINDLTFEGHEFLADIKSDNAWNKTKSIAKNIGSFSIHALKDISVGVVSELIKGIL
jgi:hypothetical protein